MRLRDNNNMDRVKIKGILHNLIKLYQQFGHISVQMHLVM